MTNNDFGTLLATVPAVKAPAIGEIISGKVLRSDGKMVLLDLSEGQFTGVISGMHMHSSTDDGSALNIGDLVEAIVIGEEKNSGLFILSLRKASQMKLIQKLHSNFDTKEIITVIPNEANKGGLLIDLDGIKGFIPVSQLTPLHYPRVEGVNPEKILEHLQKLIGKPFKVRVINVDKDGRKIIFSEKAAVEVIRTVLDTGGTPCEIIDAQALHAAPIEQVTAAVTQAIEENPQAVDDYHSGKKGALNFLVGQVMKKTRGRADPTLTNRLIREQL